MYMAAHPDRLCSVKEISEHYAISRNHLVKVVHRLSQLGYIISSKGKGGGIKLNGDPKKLRLGDLVRSLEPHMNMVECFSADRNTCRIAASCQLKHYLHDATLAFVDTLNKQTLADCVANKGLFKLARKQGL
jgi:Rrf2 family nitric oxide-sensitive transcriptional repressor